MDPSARYANELESEGYRTHMWSNGPNFTYGVHDHPYDKVIVVLDGSIRFNLEEKGTSCELKAGDRLAIPARTAHSALVGMQGVTCLEGQKIATGRFTP